LEIEHQLYPAAVDRVCEALAAGREPTTLALQEKS
jgi:hypothetical protein